MPYVYTKQGIAMLSGLLNSQKVFFKGEMFDAFSLLVDLIKTAEKSVTVIDGYANERTLNILAKKNEGVGCRLVTHPPAPLTTSDVTVFESQYGPLRISRTSDFHDRFLIIDGKVVYHIGASLKDAGRKTFAMSLINDDEIRRTLLNKLSNELDAG